MYLCYLCGRVFTYEANLSKHYDDKHKDHVFEFIGGMMIRVPSKEAYLELCRYATKAWIRMLRRFNQIKDWELTKQGRLGFSGDEEGNPTGT